MNLVPDWALCFATRVAFDVANPMRIKWPIAWISEVTTNRPLLGAELNLYFRTRDQSVSFRNVMDVLRVCLFFYLFVIGPYLTVCCVLCFLLIQKKVGAAARVLCEDAMCCSCGTIQRLHVAKKLDDKKQSTVCYFKGDETNIRARCSNPKCSCPNPKWGDVRVFLPTGSPLTDCCFGKGKRSDLTALGKCQTFSTTLSNEIQMDTKKVQQQVLVSCLLFCHVF